MSSTSENLKIGLQIGMAVVGFFAIKKLGETFGLFKSSEETASDNATSKAGEDSTETKPNNPYLSFNPNYWKALIKSFKLKYPTKTMDNNYQQNLPTSRTIYQLAEQVYLSKGIFNDNEDALFDVFSNLQTQYQLSWLSWVFSSKYKKDMLEYLKGFLSFDEQSKMLDKVKNYKQYYSLK